jgi:uncharacterized protein YkwD
MKKLMVLLVVLVSGLGYSQKPTDTIPSTNINSNLMNQCVIDEVNKERKKLGLRPLSVSEELTNLSKKHSEWVVETDRFEHSTGNNYAECVNKGGFSNFGAGETYGGLAIQIVSSWMESPPHKKILMCSEFVEGGAHIVVLFKPWIAHNNEKRKCWEYTSTIMLK